MLIYIDITKLACIRSRTVTKTDEIGFKNDNINKFFEYKIMLKR
jgi:hypothetical protein